MANLILYAIRRRSKKTMSYGTLTNAALAALCLLVTTHSVKATPMQMVPSFNCKDENNNQNFTSNGQTVPANVVPTLKSKISFYSDNNGPGGVFGPAGWACIINSGPNHYSLEVTQNLNDFDSLKVPFWDLPLIDEQILSPDGSIPQAVAFYALSASVFPRLFPGGVDQWVGGPVRSNGEQVTHAQIEEMVPLGHQDVVIHKNDRTVEFVTLAHTKGLGTPGGRHGPHTTEFPIYGVIGIGPQTNGSPPQRAEIFEFRLPENLFYLKATLEKLAEQRLAVDLQN
jgi:hypothetical protein